MIQVTGLFQNVETEAIFKNPLLEIIFHGLPKGVITCDIKLIKKFEGNKIDIGSSFGFTINRDELVFNNKIEDPHDKLFDAIQSKILDSLPLMNDNNNSCTYETV